MPRLVSGWFKMHRSATEGDIGQNIICLGLWGKLMGRANLFSTKIRWNGESRECPRGSLVVSIRTFAEECGVHRETLVRHLVYLKERGSISIEKSFEGTMITLHNFEFYQSHGVHGESKTDQVTDLGESKTDHDTDSHADVRCTPNKNTKNKELKKSIAPSSKNSRLGAVDCFAIDFDIKQLLETVSQDVQLKWLKAYPEPEWLTREFLKASAWIDANPRKRPKNITRFLGNWLSKGFESYRKTLPSNGIGSGAQSVEQLVQEIKQRRATI